MYILSLCLTNTGDKGKQAEYDIYFKLQTVEADRKHFLLLKCLNIVSTKCPKADESV